MKWVLLDLAIGGIGYAAGAYTWPIVHQWLIGAREMADKLRQRARDIETAIRGQ